jgi:hypothetical protein
VPRSSYKPENRTGAKQSGKQSEQEVKAQLRGMTEETIGVYSIPDARGHHADGNTVQIPKRIKRRL